MKATIILLTLPIFLFAQTLAPVTTSTKLAETPTSSNDTTPNTTNTLNATLPKSVMYCNQMLMESYELDGQPLSLKVPNYICTGITNNCCSYQSQLKIYKKLVQNKEKAKMFEFFDFFETTFEKIFSLFERIEKLAEQAFKHTSDYKNSNCLKIMQTITKVKVSKQKNVIMDSIRQTNKFYKAAHTGFYCSLCDAELHPFFLTKNSKLVQEKDFCRTMVRETISFNIFRNTFFPKIARLYSQFVASCDLRAVYNQNGFVPQNVKFYMRSKAQGPIDSCRKGVDRVYAMYNCQKYCSMFNPIKYNSLLTGEPEKLTQLADYLQKKIRRILLKEERFKNKKHEHCDRILSETNAAMDDDDEKKLVPSPGHIDTQIDGLSDFNRKYQTSILRPIFYKFKDDMSLKSTFDFQTPIFSYGVHKIFDLNNYKSIFAQDGINYFEIGRSADISYESAKRVFEAENPEAPESDFFKN